MDRPEFDVETDGWLKAARGVLWFSGATYALLGLCFPFLFLTALSSDPYAPEGERGVGIVMSFVLLAVGVACAAGNFVVAWGLGERKKWAWIWAVIIGAIYAPSGCLPLGVVVLWAMLRTGFKESYEAAAQKASNAPLTF